MCRAAAVPISDVCVWLFKGLIKDEAFEDGRPPSVYCIVTLRQHKHESQTFETCVLARARVCLCM